MTENYRGWVIYYGQHIGAGVNYQERWWCDIAKRGQEEIISLARDQSRGEILAAAHARVDELEQQGQRAPASAIERMSS